MLAGDKSSFAKTAVEVSVFEMYDRTPKITNMHSNGTRIDIGGVDDNDKSFVIIDNTNERWMVDSSIVYDVYVFVKSDTSDIVGWLTYTELCEAPVLEAQYVVTEEHLFQMPATFAFVPVCSQPCNANGIWDWETDSWDCFGLCGKHRYDRTASEWWPAYLSKHGGKVPETEKGA